MTAPDYAERLAELKPCAHCEGEAELQSSKGPTGELYEWVQCVDCEAVSACVDTRSMQPEEMHPVDLWNKRADATAIAELQAQVAAMREALVVADAAIKEMFRYYDGGETRGSYDGKPERNQLRKAGYVARAALQPKDQSK